MSRSTLAIRPPAEDRRDLVPARLLPPDATSEDLDAHLARHGPLPPVRDGREWRTATAEEIERSGLLGHGGAAFPTARKLESVTRRGRRPVVIANGTEGEPASEKDRTLLARAPQLVLDGASLAADLVDAVEIVMVVHREVRAVVDAAVDERRRAGLDFVPVRVVSAADGFVAGEASAVVNWVQRHRPVPLAKVQRMSERGLGGRPTLVQNVETLAHLALIVRHGAAWYREVGTSEEPGSMLVTLDGAVRRPGVHEVGIGVRVSELLACAGGPTGPLQAFLVGGYFGSWLAAGPALSLPYSARGLGVGLGAGLIVALPAGACGLSTTARLARYLSSQSAGQCGPCVYGLPAIAGEVEMLAEGRSSGIGNLERLLAEVEGRGACSHPDGVARMVASALEVFAAEVAEHLGGWCTTSGGADVVPVPTEVVA